MKPTHYFSLRSRMTPTSTQLLPAIILGALAMVFVIGMFLDIGAMAS